MKFRGNIIQTWGIVGRLAYGDTSPVRRSQTSKWPLILDISTGCLREVLLYLIAFKRDLYQTWELTLIRYGQSLLNLVLPWIQYSINTWTKVCFQGLKELLALCVIIFPFVLSFYTAYVKSKVFMFLASLKWALWHLGPKILIFTVLVMLSLKDTGISIHSNSLQGLCLFPGIVSVCGAGFNGYFKNNFTIVSCNLEHNKNLKNLRNLTRDKQSKQTILLLLNARFP